jgi:hypothetical protein
VGRLLAIELRERLAHERLEQRIRFRDRLARVDAGLEAPHHLRPPVAARFEQRCVRGLETPGHQLRRVDHRDEHVGRATRLHAEEPRRGHAHDRVGAVVDRYGASDDRRVAAETAGPVTVADDGDGNGVAFVFR